MRARGFALVAGLDEVGRGPLAGPVTAAAVILDPERAPDGLADSKTLSARRREELAGLIRQRAHAWAIASCDVGEIDRLNILRASLMAMARAVNGLATPPEFLLVDGNHTIDSHLPQLAVVGGDALCPSISAASILAKVHRDQIMLEAHQRYPAYNFASNKGYGTAEHRRALEQHGPCPLHRRSFKPVAQMSLGLGLGGGQETDLGSEAETLAADYLSRRGLSLLERNLRNRSGELDIIARDGQMLVFVEVRARSRADFGSPEETVDARKRARIIAAAREYLASLDGEPPACRFDVVAVEYRPNGPALRHLPDAFREGKG